MLSDAELVGFFHIYQLPSCLINIAVRSGSHIEEGIFLLLKGVISGILKVIFA